jgi:hypothetical protein
MIAYYSLSEREEREWNDPQWGSHFREVIQARARYKHREADRVAFLDGLGFHVLTIENPPGMTGQERHEAERTVSLPPAYPTTHDLWRDGE